MKSPFPGMDPFIEACGLWGDFHEALIASIHGQLADIAPDRYMVRFGERSYIELSRTQDDVRHAFLPDVSITVRRGRGSKTSKGGGTALAAPVKWCQPVTMQAFVRDERREGFVEIYEATGDQRLVTSIEVLSPSNKQRGSKGWKLYRRKREKRLLSQANLIEIDLLRAGTRFPMVNPWPDSPYTVLVNRADIDTLCKVWPVRLRFPLPEIPVPLVGPDHDLPLNLQPLVESVYRRSRYHMSIDYAKPLRPPLDAKDAAWMKQLLKKRSKSSK